MPLILGMCSLMRKVKRVAVAGKWELEPGHLVCAAVLCYWAWQHPALTIFCM